MSTHDSDEVLHDAPKAGIVYVLAAVVLAVATGISVWAYVAGKASASMGLGLACIAFGVMLLAAREGWCRLREARAFRAAHRSVDEPAAESEVESEVESEAVYADEGADVTPFLGEVANDDVDAASNAVVEDDDVDAADSVDEAGSVDAAVDVADPVDEVDSVDEVGSDAVAGDEHVGVVAADIDTAAAAEDDADDFDAMVAQMESESEAEDDADDFDALVAQMESEADADAESVVDDHAADEVTADAEDDSDDFDAMVAELDSKDDAVADDKNVRPSTDVAGFSLLGFGAVADEKKEK